MYLPTEPELELISVEEDIPDESENNQPLVGKLLF